MPFTLPAAGKANTRPPGQWLNDFGLALKPQTPPMRAPASTTRRSVPAAECTCISPAAFRRRIASRTGASSSARGRQRSRISGCSWLMASTRAPPAKMRGNSAACCKPSTVQSAMNTQAASACTTGSSWPMAFDAPVDRTGTAVANTFPVSTMWKGRAPMRNKASSDSCGNSGRVCVSDSTAHASPACTPHSRNTSTNMSIHLPSMRMLKAPPPASGNAQRERPMAVAAIRRTPARAR